MDKADLAQYLVNLQTLMEAQEANGQLKSAELGAEYNRMWAELKQAIEKDQKK